MIARQVLLALAGLLLLLCALGYGGVRRGKTRVFAALGAAAVVCADQYVKAAVTRAIALGGAAALLPGVVRLERVHNDGAAWSSFSGARWLLVAVTVAGLGALVWLLVKSVRHPLGVWSLALVVGGGLGNLLDRLRLGYVTDMFETEFMDFPVFNVADIFVTCGALGAAVYYWKYYDRDKRDADGADPADNGTR